MKNNFTNDYKMKQMSTTVQLIERLVVEELKLAYRLNCKPSKIDNSDEYVEPDEEFLHSIVRVLEYYMPPLEFSKWVIENNIKW